MTSLHCKNSAKIAQNHLISSSCFRTSTHACSSATGCCLPAHAWAGGTPYSPPTLTPATTSNLPCNHERQVLPVRRILIIFMCTLITYFDFEQEGNPLCNIRPRYTCTKHPVPYKRYRQAALFPSLISHFKICFGRLGRSLAEGRAGGAHHVYSFWARAQADTGARGRATDIA